MLDITLDVPNWTGFSRSYSTGHFKWFHFLRWGKISDTRGWELQLDYWGWHNLFKLLVSLDTKGGDHAGPRFELCVLGFTLALNFPDSRHWNYKEGRFYRDDEEEPGFTDWHPDDEAEELEPGAESL